MVVTKVYCDKCSELISSDRTLLKVATSPERRKRETIDLCASCLAEVVALIDARPDGSVAPSPRARVPRDKPAAAAPNGAA